MNLSFSTRGWQRYTWEENIETALTMRFNGIELYNVHKSPELTGRGGPLHKYSTAATVRELREKGLKIPCFDTSFDISEDGCLDGIRETMRIAADVQCPYVCGKAMLDEG
jgi:sugar phosphate isomerase/epimerase